MTAPGHWLTLSESAAKSSEPSWFREHRARGRARFEAEGFPTRRSEAWRYTNLRALAEGQHEIAAPVTDEVARDLSEPWRLSPSSPRVVFVDGHLSLAASSFGGLPNGVTIRPIAESFDACRELLGDSDFADGFSGLMASLSGDGVLIDVGNGVSCPDPIQVLHLSSAGGRETVSSVDVLVRVGRGAEACVFEGIGGESTASSLKSIRLHAQIDDEASFDFVSLQREVDKSTHFGSQRYELGREARLTSTILSLGARLSRNELRLRFNGTGAGATLRALCVGSGTRQLDHHTVVDHAAAECESDQAYRYLLDDSSHGVFAGRVIVARDAQQTAAEQLNNNLMLTADARIDTRPMLEIGADDVKCGHGATIGRLDPEELFYLASRGIDVARGTQMILGGWADTSVNEVRHAELRDVVRRATREKLAGLAVVGGAE